MATDTFLLEGMKDGFHGSIKVTPISVPAQSRTTVSGQLFRRKTVLITNEGSGDVFIGGYNVGFGPGHGDGNSTTCSGFAVISGAVFTLDAGRADIYAFNPNTFDVSIKLLEVS